MGRKLSHDQKRKAKLKKRAERSRKHESLAYTGNKYKMDRYAPVFFATERAIYETHVLLDRELTDRDVQFGIESLVIALRDGLPPVPPPEEERRLPREGVEELLQEEEEAEIEVLTEGDRGFLAENIRRHWRGLADVGALPSRDDLIGILRTLLNSINIWSTGGPESRGYLHYIEGFLKKAGVSVRRVTADLEPLPEPPEDPLLALGRPWIVNGDEASREDFARELKALVSAGDSERALDVCQQLLGEADDHSAVARLQAIELPGLRALES